MTTDDRLAKLRADKIEELVSKKRERLEELDPEDLLGDERLHQLCAIEIENQLDAYQQELEAMDDEELLGDGLGSRPRLSASHLPRKDEVPMDKTDKKVPDPVPCPACGVNAHVQTEMTPGGIFIEELSCPACEYGSQYLEQAHKGVGSFWENRPVVCKMDDEELLGDDLEEDDE